MTRSSFAVFWAGFLLLVYRSGDYWAWHYWSKWALIVAIFSVVFAWVIARCTTRFYFPILTLCLLSSAQAGLTALDQVGSDPIPHLMQFAVQKGALYAYLTVVIMSLLIARLPRTAHAGVMLLLAFIPFASTLATLRAWDAPANFRGAFSGNPSMNGCLIAVLLPFLISLAPFMWARLLAFALALAAILLTSSSIPIGVLAVVSLSYTLSRYHGRAIPILLATTAALAGLIACAWFMGGAFLSSSGRFEVWWAIFPWWQSHGFLLTGTGLGSASSLIPYAQAVTHADGYGWFIFMHSEPLQILWELGVPGVFAALLALGWTAARAFGRPILFSAFMGMCAQSLFDYPLRLPISCASAALIVWLILEKRPAWR